MIHKTKAGFSNTELPLQMISVRTPSAGIEDWFVAVARFAIMGAELTVVHGTEERVHINRVNLKRFSLPLTPWRYLHLPNFHHDLSVVRPAEALRLDVLFIDMH